MRQRDQKQSGLDLDVGHRPVYTFEYTCENGHGSRSGSSSSSGGSSGGSSGSSWGASDVSGGGGWQQHRTAFLFYLQSAGVWAVGPVVAAPPYKLVARSAARSPGMQGGRRCG